MRYFISFRLVSVTFFIMGQFWLFPFPDTGRTSTPFGTRSWMGLEPITLPNAVPLLGMDDDDYG